MLGESAISEKPVSAIASDEGATAAAPTSFAPPSIFVPGASASPAPWFDWRNPDPSQPRPKGRTLRGL